MVLSNSKCDGNGMRRLKLYVKSKKNYYNNNNYFLTYEINNMSGQKKKLSNLGGLIYKQKVYTAMVNII